jgi:autotransporter passenger strand-loop-strand repeat protein
VVSGGATLDVLSGGTAISTSLSAGGTEIVLAGGTASATGIAARRNPCSESI